MKNEYIEVVKRWQAGETISSEELRANVAAARAARAAAYAAKSAAARAAHAAYFAYSASYAACAARAAAYAAYNTKCVAEADRLVKRYEELTNEK